MLRFFGKAIAIYLISVSLIAEESVTGSPIDGKTQSQTCEACHGVDGNSLVGMWPKIAGLDAQYIYKQLKDFQLGTEGPRYDPTMFPLIQNLTDQELANLAAYYASQQMSIGEAAPDKIELGQKIYRGGIVTSGVPACAACHGARGDGNYLAGFPRLGGQNSEYVVAQLKKFRDGQRSNDVNSMMHGVASKMSDIEIEAIASYVAGLH